MRTAPKKTAAPFFTQAFPTFYAVIVLAASALYAILRPLYSTGALNDDAMYVLGARSLWHPSMKSMLIRPDFPLPGLPLTLAPFIPIIQPYWERLEWLSIAVTIFSVVCFKRWILRWLSLKETLVATALFAFNPLVTEFSGMIMPAAYYTAAAIGCFMLMTDLLEKPDMRKALWMGFLMGWASLVRAEGAVLLVAILAPLFFIRSCRRDAAIALVPVAFWLGVFALWAHLHPNNQSEYQGDLAALFAFWSGSLFHGLGAFLRVFHSLVINPLTLFLFRTESPLHVRAYFMLTLFLFCATLGYRALSRKYPRARPLFVAMVLFCALYFLTHLFWRVTEPRYAIPLLPFLIFFLVPGFNVLTRRLKVRPLTAIALIFILFAYAHRNAFYIHVAVDAPNPINAPPWETLTWIKKDTSSDARIMSSIAPSVELYSDRQSVGGMEASDVEMLLYRMNRVGLTHILHRASTFLTQGVAGAENLNDFWIQMERRWTRYPQRFNLVYENEREQTRVYRLSPESGFFRAYELHIQAYLRYALNDLDGAFRFANLALQADPQLGEATQLLAIIEWKRHHFKESESAFKKAIELMPGSIQPVLNLATLYHEVGMNDRSEEMIRTARMMRASHGRLQEIDQQLISIRQNWQEKRAIVFIDAP